MKQKNIWTKLLIFGVVSSIALFGCMVEYTQIEKYIYLNNSNHDIEIEIFQYDSMRDTCFTGLQTISKGDVLTQQINHGNGGGYSAGTMVCFADSVNIIYDNEKRACFGHSDTISEYNIIHGSYSIEKIADRETNYTYEFTEAHYENAETIE